MLTKSIGLVPQRIWGFNFGNSSGGELLAKRGHGVSRRDQNVIPFCCSVKLNLYTSGVWLSSTWRPFPPPWQCKMPSKQATFSFLLNWMPWLQRDLILQKPGSHRSSFYNMEYLGCGITPSSCCLGNPIIIITLLLNFLTSSWLLFQPELCILFSLSHHLVVTNETERREILKLISLEHQNSLPRVVIFWLPLKFNSLTLKYHCRCTTFMPRLEGFVQNENEVRQIAFVQVLAPSPNFIGTLPHIPGEAGALLGEECEVINTRENRTGRAIKNRITGISWISKT